ncbi:RNA-binding cell elongation regulator Jag/EloR [Streptococcus macacae]|uniref:RNA-binding protein KhpB n=1 Tax=Streptococcus macacae NCTC 11558 TaxID=764298 RepID=G5JWE6_9STRE|nr:RNA-binding cell elongation regulator Jag/EloR [Streptococcus macacae]EHJ52596.1 R3H domain protein [Streptococcus macacae NCTC 11558]SUN77800.1 RNA-binding protein [Streptococcus macacae NCTC 11558]
MVLFTGKTVEEAIDDGLRQMGLSRMKAHIQVISRGKKGFLGFGRKLARVEIKNISDNTIHKEDRQAIHEVPDTINEQNHSAASMVEETKEQVPDQHPSLQDGSDQDSKQLKEQSEKSTGNNKEAAEQTFEEFVANEFDTVDDGKDIALASEDVSKYVQTIIYEMDLEASIETTYTHRQMNLQIETPDAGRVIGYHGKVLKSLQLLAQNFLHDHYSKYFTVSLNVHDYMEHRTETLIDFAHKTAARVLESGRPFFMDPMSNNERKVVHKAISAIAGVESYSEGDDPNRYVVIAVKK